MCHELTHSAQLRCQGSVHVQSCNAHPQHRQEDLQHKAFGAVCCSIAVAGSTRRPVVPYNHANSGRTVTIIQALVCSSDHTLDATQGLLKRCLCALKRRSAVPPLPLPALSRSRH